MAKKKKGELKLIMPKHVAPIPYFRLPLKVYSAHPSGIGYDVFTQELYQELYAEHIEVQKSNDNSHYTKCAQLPRYFGFVRYVGSETKGEAAITESGEEMYAALTETPVNYLKVHELLGEAILGLLFGCRTDGVGSESYYEPFAVFFRAARDLNGITAKEYGFLIQSLDSDLVGYRTAVEAIRHHRAAGTMVPVANESQAINIADWTAIKLLENLQFLEKDANNRLKLGGQARERFGAKLERLPLCSRGYLRQLFSVWLSKEKRIDAQTINNYIVSLRAMAQDTNGPYGKSSGLFEGFYRVLTGHMPEKPVFEVSGLADYDKCYYELNKFWAMPQTKQSGDFDRLAYAECYFYAKAPQNIDNARLKNACAYYREFLTWWDANKSDFQITETEESMFKGNLGEVQKIVYGAPGTGKSFDTDKNLVDAGGNPKAKVFRTTFHPDSDYSTFVGAYKPTMKPVERIVQVGQDLKKPNYEAGIPNELKVDEKISYSFRPQAFMNAYVAAWKDTTKPVVLIIEEINRGNCAQIFGDLFQLLDRDDKSGYSMYPITADTDLKKWLAEAEQFGPAGLAGIAKPERIKQDDWVQILKGEMLALPPNLYIWATMNTSDQSLFPIDSAFKRRWDWKYVPIREGKFKDGPKKGQSMEWKVKFTVPAHQDGGQQVAAKDYTYDWWDFLKCVNALIFNTTESEDKKLGYFFVKPDGKSKPALDDNDLISADRFVGKVIFYLWNDVFKDYGIETIFKADKKPEDEAKGVEFQAFFNEEDDHANVRTLLKFFKQLGLKSDEEKKSAVNPQVQEGDVKLEV